MKANIRPDLFKHLMKPNFTRRASRNFTAKALGFTRSMVGWGVYWESRVFLFLGFCWYPFNPTYDIIHACIRLSFAETWCLIKAPIRVYGF